MIDIRPLLKLVKMAHYVREYEGAIKNRPSRETGYMRYTKRRKTKQKHNTICVGYHYEQTNTYNVNKT